MAEQSQNPGAVTNSFTKGMVKDMNETFIGEGLWTHARNLVNNNHDGQTGIVGNEPANLHCVTLPYDLIGIIHLVDDQWVVFTTDDTNSEIGIFDESKCSYEKKVNASCLNFKRSHLITGASRARFDCERPVYWADGLNPDRFIDLDNIPWKYTEKIVDGCIIKTNTTELDCEKIRMAPLVTHPCLTISKGRVSGTLPNGSYQAAIAYSESGIRMTDYIGISEVQPLFVHQNVGSSLEIVIDQIDTDFSEFELVLLARINGTTVAKKIGYYSTSQGTIHVDRWDQEYETVPVSSVVFRGDHHEKSDAMYEVNNYLLKVGDYSKFKFNYQLLANKIVTNWVAVEYSPQYYSKGGNNTGYLRDEQYAFFIRWVYNTGDRSESYHIPGRAALPTEKDFLFGEDAFEAVDGAEVKRWQVENTATVESQTSYSLEDGGRVVAVGKMGYWESTEKYPADRPDIWGDLCGKPIRHHKMPDETVHPVFYPYNKVNNSIVVLGVQFSNITHPVDNKGIPIASIVGYEILRGSREGNKTIIAKGLFNNMREYKVPGNTTVKGLYQNFPYNDLRPDYYHVSSDKLIVNGGDNDKSDPLTGYREDVFSFHSPEVTFNNPYLNASEVKIYQDLSGTATGQFEEPYKHPKVTLLSDKAGKLALEIAIGIAITTGLGKGNISFGGTSDLPMKVDIAGGKMNLPAVGGAAGVGTTTVNAIFIGAQAALDIAIMGATAIVIADTVIKLLDKVARKQQYALQYFSHGFYDTIQAKQGNKRVKVADSVYVNNSVSVLGEYRISNVNRSGYVVVKTEKPISKPRVEDNSRVLIDDAKGPRKLYTSFNTTISSNYGALKINMPSQYGQLYGIKQFPITGGCVLSANISALASTPVLFGGDTYINRYTEKNSMLFFTDWMLSEPDGTEWQYQNFMSMPYTRFWMDSTNEDYSDLDVGLKFQSPLNIELTPPKVELQSPVKVVTTLGKKKRSLNRLSSDDKIEVRGAYFYLFNSGVRDFYVESEINLAYRDWEDDFAKKHYDVERFTDLQTMFRSDIIKSGNFYKYDYNLSVSKLFGSHISWGSMLDRSYNPAVAETCFIYQPYRVRYSLPQQLEARKDNWRMFLINNYKDFDSPVTSIKPIEKTGALFMMARQSPMKFMGVEELKLDGTGAKITIGDGGLFNQPLQSVVNSDTSFEYGSCQNKFAVINTIYGLFWVSQNQGKVFQFGGQINEISRNGMKWWFSKYLPSELLKVYPDYTLYDNPVAGIGVQMIYDNTNEILYISKKDYKPKVKTLSIDKDGFFYISGFETVTIPGTTTTTCPPGYVLRNGSCIKTETVDPISSGSVVTLTRTPYQSYGTTGTKVYDDASLTSTFTLLNTSNPFWIRTANPVDWNTYTEAQKQAYDLNNGPVNRLSVWGVQLNGSGVPINNYNQSTWSWSGGSASSVGTTVTVSSTTGLAAGMYLYKASGTGTLVSLTTVVSVLSSTQFTISDAPTVALSGAGLTASFPGVPPLNQWIGFDVCINITETKVYHVGIAADNRYRLSLDGNIILQDESGQTSTFNYLHIYPVTITAGSHILKLEGTNDGNYAGFGCEIYDLSGIGTSVVTYLNSQTNYDNLSSRIVFTTRTATQFSSNIFTCPTGYGLTNPTCNKPECARTMTVAPNITTTPEVTKKVSTKVYVSLNNPDYFEDASWTVSYDPKSQVWLSFHDWKPTFVIPGKTHFMTVDYNSIWKHNQRCDLFCNFYGKDYPFDIEFVSSTGQTVNSVRSVEYLLEAYRYYNDCSDKFHILDQNFDAAIIYNSEQVSGLLELQIKDKKNPLTLLSFPQVGTSSIKIQYSKEENKYRFNQFWDITKDRGEFSGISTPMFITKANGYEYTINPQYVNYQKSPLERKKFRHQVNRVFLRRLNSGDVKLLFKLSNQKLNQSFR